MRCATVVPWLSLLALAAVGCGGSSDGPNGPPGLTNSIVFVSDRSGSDELYIMNGDGSNVREIPTRGGRKSFPVVSPDGKKSHLRSSMW